MFEWSWEPTILLGLAFQAGAYLACVGPLRHYFPKSKPVPSWQVQTFLFGVLVLFIALVSPLSILSDGYLLSAHMVQHLLVTMVAPPLLLIGTPRWLFRPLVRRRLGLAIGRVLTHPIITFVVFNLILTLWHVPAYYDRSLNEPAVHAIQHVMFIAAATLTWWPIVSPLDELPRLPDPLQVLYLFLASIPPTVLGAVITFAGDVLYPTYARAPRAWGLSPETDQQLGGLIMWVIGALIYLGVLTAVFFRWFNQDETVASVDGYRSVS